LYQTNNNLIDFVVQNEVTVFKLRHRLEPDYYKCITALISHASDADNVLLGWQYFTVFYLLVLICETKA